MPATRVVFFVDDVGRIPALDWLDSPRNVPVRARDKCIVRVERLRELGYELRRPEADFLRDEVYELRAKMGRVNYRLLYFFHGGLAVISHGFTKEGEVPAQEIDVAVNRKRQFAQNPVKHSYAGDV